MSTQNFGWWRENEELVDGVTPYPASQLTRVHDAVDANLTGLLKAFGAGVIENEGATSFKVTAGTGFHVNIAAGRAILESPTAGFAFVESLSVVDWGPLEANRGVGDEIYLFVIQETAEKDGRPSFDVSDIDTYDGGVLLASITTGASTVSGVVDLREFAGGGGEGTGDVVGPASSVADNFAIFDGTTGKLLKDSGKPVPSGNPVGTTATQTLTNKTLQSPVLTGTPTAPTPATSDSSTKVATTALVDAKIAELGGGDVVSVNGMGGVVVLDAGDLGLGNVDNTADADKPISDLTQAALDDKIDSSEKGADNGVATLGGTGKVPVAQLPAAIGGTSAGTISSSDQTKLNGIATGATANDTDANLKARANHTGTQAISTVTGLQTALDGKIPATEKGAANGVAELDGDGKVPAEQLPDGIGGGTFATTEEAEAGVNTTAYMNPATTAAAIAALAPTGGGSVSNFGARLTTGSSQVIANNALTKLEFETDDYDDGFRNEAFPPGTLLTVPTGGAGRYIVTAFVHFTNDGSAGLRYAELVYFGAVDSDAKSVAAGEPCDLKLQWQGYLNDGDDLSINVQIVNGSGSASCTIPADGKTWIAVEKLGVGSGGGGGGASYAFEDLPSPSPAGQFIYCPDGRYGSPCWGASDGSAWYDPKTDLLLSSFTPASLTGLAAWWRADEFNSGTGVWNDLSSNNRDLSDVSGTVTRANNVINGNPVVRFSSGSIKYDSVVDPILTGAIQTIFVVYKATNGATQYIFDTGDDSSTSRRLVQSNNTTLSVTRDNGGGAVSNADYVPGAFAQGTLQINGVSSICRIFVEGNETTGTNTMSSTANNNGYPFVVGARFERNANFLAGDIAELIICNSALTTPVIEETEAYLRIKYGLL